MLGPILRGTLINLEPPRVEDLELFVKWFGDPEKTQNLLARFPFTLKQEQEWFDRVAGSQTDVFWVIRLDGVTVGNTAIHNLDWINRRGITGTFIAEQVHRSRGFGSEVVRLRTRYAFEELGLERLETESFAHNISMHRALQKSGYREIGRRRHYVFKGGVWIAALIFELLREDWLALQAS